MLTITSRASEAIEALLSSASVPDGAGVRLEQSETAGGGVGIGMSVVAEPAPDDQVIDGGGGVHDVYVASETAGLLDDQELDAEVIGDQVSFSFRRRGSSLDGA